MKSNLTWFSVHLCGPLRPLWLINEEAVKLTQAFISFSRKA